MYLNYCFLKHSFSLWYGDSISSVRWFWLLSRSMLQSAYWRANIGIDSQPKWRTWSSSVLLACLTCTQYMQGCFCPHFVHKIITKNSYVNIFPCWCPVTKTKSLPMASFPEIPCKTYFPHRLNWIRSIHS